MPRFTDKIKDILLSSTVFIGVILLWQVSSSTGILPKWIIPSPTHTLFTFWGQLTRGDLFKLTLMSLANVIPAFLAAAAIAILVGVPTGLNHVCKKILLPPIFLLYMIPSLALLPLIILFLGFTRWSIFAVVFVSAFSKIIYSVIGGVQSINKDWILAGRNFGLTNIGVVFKIVLPGSLPHLISGARLGFGSAWRSLIGAEMLVASMGGLGKFIWFAQWHFAFDKVLAGIAVIAIIGMVVEQFVFRRVEDWVNVRWNTVLQKS